MSYSSLIPWTLIWIAQGQTSTPDYSVLGLGLLCLLVLGAAIGGVYWLAKRRQESSGAAPPDQKRQDS
jgi:hypothetical protein